MAGQSMDEMVTVTITPQRQSDGSIVFNWNDNGRSRLGLLVVGSTPHRNAKRALESWQAAQGRTARGLGPAQAVGSRSKPPSLNQPAPAVSRAPTVTLTRRHAENACRNYQNTLAKRR